ncbi:MAG: hypothetical protein QNJ40_22900 [Xanthomonadales bacterium]|nr:hypothetical protein [Xanthomonadales bacterium]
MAAPRKAFLITITLGLLAAACTPLRVVDNAGPVPGPPLLLAVEFRVWQTVSGEVLPEPIASSSFTAAIADTLERNLSNACTATDAAVEEARGGLALYRRLSEEMLARPQLADGSHGVGPSLQGLVTGQECRQGLVLMGEWDSVRGWLSLGSIDLASGKLLRLAAVEFDQAEPDLLRRHTRRLLRKVSP